MQPGYDSKVWMEFMRKPNKSREKLYAENLIGQLVKSLNTLLDMAAEDTATAWYIRNKVQDIAMSIVNDLIDGRRK